MKTTNNNLIHSVHFDKESTVHHFDANKAPVKKAPITHEPLTVEDGYDPAPLPPAFSHQHIQNIVGQALTDTTNELAQFSPNANNRNYKLYKLNVKNYGKFLTEIFNLPNLLGRMGRQNESNVTMRLRESLQDRVIEDVLEPIKKSFKDGELNKDEAMEQAKASLTQIQSDPEIRKIIDRINSANISSAKYEFDGKKKSGTDRGNTTLKLYNLRKEMLQRLTRMLE